MSEHVESYYAATANSDMHRASLQEPVQADVCVIGAGFTGVSSALHLAERGFKVVLLESSRVGWGASGRNGGQLFVGQRRSQEDLEAWFGRERARMLWDLGLEAVDLVTGRVRKHDIRCDLKPGIVSVAAKPSHMDYLRAKIERLREHYGYDKARLLDAAETARMVGTDRYAGADLDMGCWHLHPLNFVQGMAEIAEAAGVRIYEQSTVTGISKADPALVTTPTGQVTARFVVLACNGYLGKLEPRIAVRAMPINNFMLATEPLDESTAKGLIPDDVAVCDTKFVVNYWRLSADRRLLFGGGETYSPNFPRDIRAFVRPYMLKVYPRLANARIDYGWGGTLAITLKRLPHFGRLRPNVFFVQGFSGQGVALGNLAGKLVAEAIGGTAERFDVMAGLPMPAFPGGTLLRYPAMVLGMLYYSILDKL